MGSARGSRPPGVRDLALAISPDFVVRRATVAGTTLEVAATNEERAAFYVTRAAEFLRWSGEKLGPYPYPVLAVADADLPASFGGLEYPGLIFLSRSVPARITAGGRRPGRDSTFTRSCTSGSTRSVGNDQIADPWLDEAFVTYLAYRYYREVRPDLAPAVYERTIAGTTGGAVDGTVYDFPSDPPYFGVVYRRGARFLETLHARMGDGPFWSLLREHVATYRDRIASPRSFLDRALATSPTPVGPLIAEYFSYGAFRTADAAHLERRGAVRHLVRNGHRLRRGRLPGDPGSGLPGSTQDGGRPVEQSDAGPHGRRSRARTCCWCGSGTTTRCCSSGDGGWRSAGRRPSTPTRHPDRAALRTLARSDLRGGGSLRLSAPRRGRAARSRRGQITRRAPLAMRGAGPGASAPAPATSRAARQAPRARRPRWRRRARSRRPSERTSLASSFITDP